ncbi:aminopeptidase [Brevibacillus aydinogluensis]|jgi:aminopeptidase|uniref:Aminopeptidase n=1 Tax=Brevibacillus aydinogluensis TaxID=927786 RepID=A0AA48MA17_9BACL|nr:aminopeptidase [Brevibacillus aydinogluensis]CAJ1004023.1 Aminopeptidase [Brevibacillus aydinogluensis]
MNAADRMLDRYAELAVKIGVNVQPGQTLVINAPLCTAELVRKIAKTAYLTGAKHVYTEWTDDELTRLQYDLAPYEALTEYPMWRAKAYEELAENGAAFLFIIATDPDLLKGVNPERIAAADKAMRTAMYTFRNYTMNNSVSWSVIAAPSPAWAAKVFPNLPESEQVSALWNAIFRATRTDVDDPVTAWRNHQAALNEKVTYLNGKQYRCLHFKAPGTDLSVQLPPGHRWQGGASVTANGVPFTANIPTEEVYTAPLKDGVNGVVSSTMPLSHNGNLIENFTLRFERGRIVEVTAETGFDVLQKLIETDEGSRYLGEVALVPHQSPISQSNLIFYNTLIDENASNHLAIGNAYPVCLEGGDNLSPEEMEQRGLNTSLMHVDFMIGSAEMDIDGELADGTREPIFRNGNWAF